MKKKMKPKPGALVVGVRIKKCRKALGMTQEDLEEVSGVSQNHISNLERGVSQLGLEALVKLAPALQVTTDFLRTGKNGGTALIPQLESIMGWVSEQDEETQLRIFRILMDVKDMIQKSGT